MDYREDASKDPPLEFLRLEDPDFLFDDPEKEDQEDPETDSPFLPERPGAFPDGKKPYISKKEEYRLIAIAKGDDPEKRQIAIAALLEAHEDFLWKKVRAKRRYFSENIRPEDLLQEARMGLMRAIEKFDPERDTRLLTYAGWWVEQQIDRYTLKNTTTQSVPANLASAYREILDPYRDYMKARHREKGDEPLSGEEKQKIFDLTGKWPHEIEKLRASIYDRTYSLETPIGDGDETFLDTLTEGPFAPPDALASHLSDGESIETLIANAELTERERDILFARFGIGTDDENPVTLEEIRKLFNISRERVRQIEKKALEKLRRAAKTAHNTGRTTHPSPKYPAAPDSDAPAPAAKQNHPEEKITTTTETESQKKGDETDMETGIIKTLAQAESRQSELHPLPVTEWEGYKCLTAGTLQSVSSIYQIVMEIQKTGKPIVFFDAQKKSIRGILVLPEMADRLVSEAREQDVFPIGSLPSGYKAHINSARRKGVAWFREGGGDQNTVLALLPPTRQALNLLKSLYEKNDVPDVTPVQVPGITETPSAPDVESPLPSPQAAAPAPAHGLTQEVEPHTGHAALPVQALETGEQEGPPTSLAESFRQEILSGNPDDTAPVPTYDLPNPRDLVQTLRTLFAAVSETASNPQMPIRIECPGNAVLVSADPGIVDYLLYQAETEGRSALEIEVSDAAPRDKGPVMLVASFAGAAKGGVCIVPVDDAKVAFFPDDGRFEAAQFMQAVLNCTFPQPRGAG